MNFYVQRKNTHENNKTEIFKPRKQSTACPTACPTACLPVCLRPRLPAFRAYVRLKC